MWKNLSLRMRLVLPLGTMFVAALLLGAISLQLFAPIQLKEESEPAARAVKAVAGALNSALGVSANPQQTLDAFVQSLGASEGIRFRRMGAETPLHSPVEVRNRPERVPNWFVDLLSVPEMGASFPVNIDGKPVGDILFSPDLSADIYEKWVGFLALVSSVVALMIVTGAIAYFTAGTVVDALRSLAEGLTRMRSGDYEHLIAASGPPEIRRSAEEANELARTLSRLSQDNRSLLRKIVSLQDDERRDIARDLHDELGPLLFGHPGQRGGAAGWRCRRTGNSALRSKRCFNRSRRCSWRTAVSSTGCGRSISRNWGSRRVSRPCCSMRDRRRPASSWPCGSIPA